MHLFLLLSQMSSLALAAKLTISVPQSAVLQNPSTLPSTTFATLHAHGAPHTAYINRNSAFTFANLTTGSYLFSAHCRDYFFEPLRVDVGLDAEGSEKVEVWQTFRGNEWSNKGEKRGEGLVDVHATVNVLGVKDYYQKREGFNVIGFLKSPMILMALFSLGMIVGVPYMMENSKWPSFFFLVFFFFESHSCVTF